MGGLLGALVSLFHFFGFLLRSSRVLRVFTGVLFAFFAIWYLCYAFIYKDSGWCYFYGFLCVFYLGLAVVCYFSRSLFGMTENMKALRGTEALATIMKDDIAEET